MPSLEDYARTRKPVAGDTMRWFDARAELAAEVIDGFSKYPVGVIWRWLKQDHEFPFSLTALHAFRDRQSR